MRDKQIDILKLVGLLFIILAHTDPPKIIFQLRNFDVVLLIVCSSLLFFQYNKKENSFNYLLYRVKRLILPTYIFLIFYFVIMFLFSRSSVNSKVLFETFTFYGGLSYVWIIKVYIIIALLLPLSKYIYNKKGATFLIFLTTILYFIYELLYHFGIFDNKIINYFFAYIIPCFTIINCSLILVKCSSKKIMAYSGICFIIFIIIALYLYNINNCFIDTNYAKYPFRMYYLSYSFFAIGILYLLVKKYKDLLYNNIVSFFSSHSLWMYLWHILVLSSIQFLLPNIQWYIKYAIIIIITSIIVLLQSIVVDYLEKRIKNNNFLKVFKG